MPENLTAAVLCLYERKHRISFPRGRRDSWGRWCPAPSETCWYCDNLRTPSYAYPYALYAHCKSAAHVANLFGVDRKALIEGLAEYERSLVNVVT